MARFQARSALTGVGFTTSEAEGVVNHPVRRKILMVLMLLGSAGLVRAISSLILTFVKDQDQGIEAWTKVLVLGVSVAVLWFVAGSRSFDRGSSFLINKALNRFSNLNPVDYEKLLHLHKDYRIRELRLTDEGWLTSRPLGEIRLRAEGIVVLGVKRADGRFVGTPDGGTWVRPGDTVLLYGRSRAIENLINRKNDPSGRRDRQEAVQEQREVVRRQKSEEKETEKAG